MRRYAGGFAYVLAGLAAGAASAFLVIENTGVKSAGSSELWTSRAKGLSGDSAIYVRAHYLLQGRLPPSTGQIDEATADTDSDGNVLTSSCRYTVTSTGALPRWWSIAVMTDGSESSSPQVIADTDSVIREADGSAVIHAAATPQPGNWLNTGAAGRFTLLYSAVAAGTQRLPGAPPFNIRREECP